MKSFSLFIISFFIICLAPAQIVNTRQSLWSDATAWSNNSIPGPDDDVVLNYEIIIDIDAYCRSFNLNGHSATIDSGAHLFITGSNDNADTLLARYAEIDTTVSPADTFQTIDFYYDNLKRNTSYVKTKYSSNGNINNQVSRYFFYIDSSRLPYMSSGVSGGSPRFFQYQNGRLIYDSSESYVIHYTYLSNAIIRQTVNISTSGIVTDTSYVEYDGNGNIIHQIDTTLSDGARNFYYVFDNHPNPFRSTQLNCWRVLNGIETFIEESFAKNNMLQVDQYYYYHYQGLYGFGYKPNSYPKEIWAYDPANPAIRRRGKGIFTFTR